MLLLTENENFENKKQFWLTVHNKKRRNTFQIGTIFAIFIEVGEVLDFVIKIIVCHMYLLEGLIWGWCYNWSYNVCWNKTFNQCHSCFTRKSKRQLFKSSRKVSVKALLLRRKKSLEKKIKRMKITKLYV